MEYVVCDTTVVSDLRRGGQGCSAMTILTQAVKVISVVTIGELRAGAILAGWGERRRAGLEATINAYVHVDVDGETADVWSRLQAECVRLGRNVGLNDLWIAATSLRLGCPVASLDADFGRIPGLQLVTAAGVETQTT